MAMYQAQLNTMVMWLDQWNESGQTVALFKMLTRLAPTQARFLSIALDASLTECSELALREQEANNPGFVGSLLYEEKPIAMSQLLVHLPLLRPGNCEALAPYLTLVPLLLSHSLQSGELVEEARQLLAYVLIHPALKDSRNTFRPWRRSFGDRIINGSNPPSTISQNEENEEPKVRRSNSLTPPFAVTSNVETVWTSQDDLSVVPNRVRRFSLSSEHLLSPQSSQASSGSGSESHLEFETQAIRDIRLWLKSLRLHKYHNLFSQLTYDQMLGLTEETFDATLERFGTTGVVTQGARRKIILNVAKLRERHDTLCRLEQDLSHGGGSVLTAMEELKAILATPIKVTAEDDLSTDNIPTQFTKVLGKVCTEVMMSADEETASLFIFLLDYTLHHEAFSPFHKRLSSWRQQIHHHQAHLRTMYRGDYSHTPTPLRGGMHPTGYKMPSRAYLHRASLSTANNYPGAAATFLAKRPSLQDPLPELSDNHPSVQRTQSAPPNPLPSSNNTVPTSESSIEPTDPELTSRLESLCLRMTEPLLFGP